MYGQPYRPEPTGSNTFTRAKIDRLTGGRTAPRTRSVP